MRSVRERVLPEDPLAIEGDVADGKHGSIGRDPLPHAVGVPTRDTCLLRVVVLGPGDAVIEREIRREQTRDPRLVPVPATVRRAEDDALPRPPAAVAAPRPPRGGAHGAG